MDVLLAAIIVPILWEPAMVTSLVCFQSGNIQLLGADMVAGYCSENKSSYMEIVAVISLNMIFNFLINVHFVERNLIQHNNHATRM